MWYYITKYADIIIHWMSTFDYFNKIYLFNYKCLFYLFMVQI